MGGTSSSLAPTTTNYTTQTSGNVGAGAVLNNASVLPVNLSGATNSTATIQDVSPSVFAAAASVANNALTDNALVTNASVNLASSIAARSAELAAGSTGSGPYQGLISSAGKYILGAILVVVIGIGLIFGFRRKKTDER